MYAIIFHMNPLENNPNSPQKSHSNESALTIKKAEYLELVNDFAMLISLNASKLEQQIISGKEQELVELRQNLRKPIINGLNYADFTAKYGATLTKPEISKTLIAKIYEFLLYIEPQLSILKPDALWRDKFESVKKKYVNLVS